VPAFTFRVLEGCDRGHLFRVLSPPVTIGREQGNDLQLGDEGVSRFHARIEIHNGELVLTDLGSTNGTRVNGAAVKTHRLQAGDQVGIGRCLLCFDLEPGGATAAAPADTGGSVTHWLQLLQQGEEEAVRAIWQRYGARLIALARDRLRQRGAARRVADEEDVALSVFDSFCRGAEQGRFPDLGGRDNLWQLLVVLTARKALRQAQYERRASRGGGRVVAAVDLAAADPDDGAVLEQIVGREPSPEFAAAVAEECDRLFDLLGDDELRMIARRRMEGHTNAEVAALLGCLERTVERKLRVIRGLWEGVS
jgi:DNA-directed RNA polymerase specialized sigma24 family protein